MPGTRWAGTVIGMKTSIPPTTASNPATNPDADPPANPAAVPDPRRYWPHLALGAFAVAGALAVSGCSITTDTPLHVTDVARAVTPGHDILGKVSYPDGKITVTLAPSASPIRDGHRTHGQTPCHYHRPSHRFTCSTTDLPQGLYLVQVTDAAQPGEGTAQAQVTITDFAGYDPHLLAGDGSEKAKVGPLDLKLTGWRPGVAVQITIVDENATTVFTGSAVPDEQGAATLHTTPLKAGHHNIDASDGLWKINGDEGAYNNAYSGIEIS